MDGFVSRNANEVIQVIEVVEIPFFPQVTHMTSQIDSHSIPRRHSYRNAGK